MQAGESGSYAAPGQGVRQVPVADAAGPGQGLGASAHGWFDDDCHENLVGFFLVGIAFHDRPFSMPYAGELRMVDGVRTRKSKPAAVFGAVDRGAAYKLSWPTKSNSLNCAPIRPGLHFAYDSREPW
jgi:hypothetical protein